jgi:hypothetical protein
MKWLVAKVDSLIGTIFAAVMGLLAGQFLAFIQQYRQRLGGHLAEAQLAERQTREARGGQPTPELLQTMSDRVTDLAGGVNAIGTASPFALPFQFLLNFDADIVFGTLHDFQPALPLDAPSLVYGISGMVIGWALYGSIKRLGGRLVRGKV